MNLVEIIVHVKDTGKAITDVNAVGAAFKGLGIAAAGSLGLGLATPLAAAGLALGSFAAVAAPTLLKVKDAITKTGAAGKEAWADLDPGQRDLARNIQGLKGQFDDLAHSLEPIVIDVANLAVKTGQSLLPAIEGFAKAGAKVLEGVLKPMNKLFQSDFFHGFVKQMSDLAAKAGPALGDGLVQIAKAVFKLMEAVGPQGPGLISALAQAISDVVSAATPLAKTLLQAIGPLTQTKAGVDLLAGSITALGVAMLLGPGKYTKFIAAIAGIGVAVNASKKQGDSLGGALEGIINAWNALVNVAAQVVTRTAQGAVDAVLLIVEAVPRALSKIPIIGEKWKGVADAIANTRHSADKFFNNFVDGLHKAQSQADLKIKVEGNITDLQQKLATARALLGDPNLTKARRAQIEANIAQLRNQIARAKQELASIDGKVAHTYVENQVTTTYIGGVPVGRHKRASGGIIGAAASGGVRGNLVEVGEHGRELVRLPVGSQVMSNPDSERMLSQMGGGGGSQRIILEVRGGGSEFEAFMAKFIRNYVRVYGQGNAQTAFGS